MHHSACPPSNLPNIQPHTPSSLPTIQPTLHPACPPISLATVHSALHPACPQFSLLTIQSAHHPTCSPSSLSAIKPALPHACPPFILPTSGLPTIKLREHSGSVVECLTRDREAVGLSITGLTALCPSARQINPSLELVQPRKTCPYITERLLMGCKESNQTNKTI